MRATVLAVAFAVAGCGDSLGPPRLLDRTLPDARVGLFYGAALRASGGRLPLSFRVESGPLPPGLHLSVDGVLEGFPQASGRFDFRVVVSDDSALTDLADLSLRVLEPDGPLAIPAQDLPVGHVGDPYAAAIRTTGGVTPVVFSLIEGPLPDGLVLGADGVIEGEPIEAGEASFTAGSTDAIGDWAQRSLAIAVAQAVNLVTERLPPTELGAPYDVAFETVGGVPPIVYSVARGDLPPDIDLSPDGHLAGAGTEDGPWTFTVRAGDAAGGFDEERYTVHVVDGLVRIDHPDVVLGDACDLPGVQDAVAYEATLDIARSGALTELDVYVDVEYADMGFLSLELESPDGESVLLKSWSGIGGGRSGLETIFDEEDGPAGRLDVFAGDNPIGTWTLRAIVHRVDDGWVKDCPGEGRIAGFGLLLRFDGSSEDYVLASGWSPNNLFAEPTARVTNAGLDQDSFTVTLRQFTAGADGIREAGKGDDVDLGASGVAWSTNLRPEQGTIDSGTGLFQAGEETGRRRNEADVDGPGLLSGDLGGGVVVDLEVFVVAPDWVP